MTDETTEPRDDADQPAEESAEQSPDEASSSEDQAEQGAEPEEGHHGKHPVREGVAKAVGYTVEVASILSQQGGPAVKAERDVAEADTEELIDRIDGEE